MVFEHFALNVLDIDAVVQWYIQHIGLVVVSAQKEAPFMHFLADDSGRVVMELYQRSDAVSVDFRQQHPLTFHVAFVSKNAQQDSDRLQAVGATYVEEVKKQDGSHLIMLRDPFGMPLQVCQRSTPF